MKFWVYIGSYVSWGLSGLYFLLVLCLFMSIKITVAVMKTPAVFISSNMRTFFVPVIAFLITALYVAFWIVDAAYLTSAGKIEGSGGSQYRKLVW